MTKLGLKRGTVKLMVHQVAWRENFNVERKKIAALKNKYIRAIEHVGSTSILGMPAKPIVDIVVGIDIYRNFRKLIKDLARIGYTYRFEPRRYQALFIKTNGGRITHHLKVVRHGGASWGEYVNFKNQLLRNRKDFEIYRKLKLKLAKEFPDDRKAYTATKAELIRRISAKFSPQ